ncbi:phosphatidylinositol polyphosphate 5-phosphatase type IV-like isoform X2 [Pecten maximus]|uniref:phosphatidylinositol polyphosphate 5-phosphatase type IV-like isoform X2 n=1 Tax=Pecten maximus TaxID=6579 RepID=UPI001458BA80|nr:phosphatidylinositol polyphosphate 5-phosphatase type IV-like isoform X2 [Pecten maximus]
MYHGNKMEVETTTLNQNSKKPPTETSTPAPHKGKKKRSAISKITEKRRNNESGSEFGSTYSLQSNASRLTETKEREVNKTELNYNGNKDLNKSQNAKAAVEKVAASVKDSDYHISGNKDSVKITPKPKPRDKKFESVLRPEELSPPPMDIDSDSDDDKHDGISRKAPSDATIHRFRALKMATNERTNSVESLRNSPFTPKPPSTPRSEQKSNSNKATSPPESDKKVRQKSVKQKGEKRFRDPNSSGEEPEVGAKSKKQSCSQTDLKRMDDVQQISDTNPSSRGDQNATIDSETDNNRYQNILTGDSLPHKTGRLAPITSKNHPPPLTEDISSHALKTAYKTDSSYTLNKYLESVPTAGSPRVPGSPLQKPPIHPPFDTMSQRSMSSSGILHQIPITEARARTGSGNASVSSSLLGASELDRYLQDRRIKVWIGSWNMGEIKEFKASLQDFLLPEASDFVQDLYAIGTQENNMNKKEWEVIIQTTLGTSHVLFYSATHGSLHLAIFIRRDLIWFCSEAEEDQVTTRAVTMVKTKGAVAVAFSFFGTSFLFINSHFASNRSNHSDSGKLKERINDFQKINSSLKLPKTASGSQTNVQGPASSKFDSVFWFGDLNFRLEKGRHTVEDLVHAIVEQEHPNFEDLLLGDELAHCIYQDKAFQGFTEGRINFKPTYKFDLNSEAYDTSPKFRIPSYTDRILYHSKKKNQINCVHYDAVMNIRVSDHRPVYGVFEAAVKPGTESTQLANGKFDRDVYVAAQKRRALITPAPAPQPSQKSSGVCSIQ